MGSNMQLGMGRNSAGWGKKKNSTRLSFRQNKVPLTQPNTKGIFKSRSLLTQRSQSSVCTEFMVWPGMLRLSGEFVLHPVPSWESGEALQLLCLLQFSTFPQCEHYRFFNKFFSLSLLFGIFILDYMLHYHIHTYHTILQTPEFNRHHEIVQSSN